MQWGFAFIAFHSPLLPFFLGGVAINFATSCCIKHIILSCIKFLPSSDHTENVLLLFFKLLIDSPGPGSTCKAFQGLGNINKHMLWHQLSLSLNLALTRRLALDGFSFYMLSFLHQHSKPLKLLLASQEQIWGIKN